MTEILTESFCERCGTRYTFEPVENRRRSFGAIGTLGRGIKHFVSDPGSSLDEAFAVARSEQEQRATNHSLEAFHRTFNFCLTCRQYTCGDCWNTVEGRCLTCAPTGESADVPAPRMDTAIPLLPFEQPRARVPIVVEGAVALDDGPWIGSEEEIREKFAATGTTTALPASGDGLDAIWASSVVEESAPGRDDTAPEAEAEAAPLPDWPFSAATSMTDLTTGATTGANWPFSATDPLVDVAAPPLPTVETDGIEAAALAEAEAAVAGVEEPEAGAQGPALEHLNGAEQLTFEPGQNIDDQLAEYERRMAFKPDVEPEAVVAEPEPEPIAAEAEAAVAEPDAEPEAVDAEPEPEPVAAAIEPELTPLEIEPELVAAETEPEPLAVAPDEEAPLAAAKARPVAPIEPIPTAIGKPFPATILDGPLAWPEPGVAAAAFEPHWPDIPTPRRRAAEPMTAAQAQIPTPPLTGLRRIGANLPSVGAAPPPVPAHSCPSCGLSLSANARFCRRCGTSQQAAAAR